MTYPLKVAMIRLCGGFHIWGMPQMDGLYIIENPTEINDLGVPLF